MASSFQQQDLPGEQAKTQTQNGESVGPGGYKSIVFRGWKYPPFCKASVLEDILNRAELRADDIVIATYPKCGTTWMQQIVLSLLAGGDGSKVRDPMKLSPWPEGLLSMGRIPNTDEWNTWRPKDGSQVVEPGRRGTINLCFF